MIAPNNANNIPVDCLSIFRLNEKKSGKLSQNEMDSALVDLSVLISNFLF